MAPYWIYFALLYSVCWPTGQGVEINFKVSGADGIIESPNYPYTYPLNLSCTWTISDQNAKYIKLTFLDFHIEKAKRCIYDFVQVRDDLQKPWSKVVKHCGFRAPELTKSRGNTLQLRFFSDGLDIVERGFRAKWESELKTSVLGNCEPKSDPSSKPRPCIGKRKTKTLIYHKICPTPTDFVKVANCPCDTYQDMKDSENPFWVQKFVLRKQNDVQPKTSASSLSKYNSTGKNAVRSGMSAETGRKRGSIKVLISTFSSVLTLFIAVSLVLLVLLFRKNKEIFELRQNCNKQSSRFSWASYLHPTTPAFQNQSHNDKGYMQVPTFSRTSPCSRSNTSSFNGIKITTNTLSPGRPCSKKARTVNKDWNSHRMISHMMRTSDDGQRSQSSSDEVNDNSGDETSDVYVSSGLNSPVQRSSRGCRCPKRNYYDV